MKKETQKKQVILPAISVKNISKTFVVPHEKISTLRGVFTSMFKKKTHDVLDALKNVSFEVKKGEFFGIIGRNGSGKSTLLKILAGIYSSSSGSVVINGAISPFLELGIGFNPELSGRDNIYLNATVLGMTKKQIDEKFNDIVAFSELERFIDQKLKNYSSGMHVRLAFSVAIHANRKILLMDEVLAVGDSNFQGKCLKEFNRYREMGKTVILVSHDVSVIQRYCDRAILLRDGEILKIGKAEDVGNEYIYQNMSDEEKRMKEEKDLKEKAKMLIEDTNNVIQSTIETQKHQKIAEIVDAVFLDKYGNEKNIFETGDMIDIRINFKINQKVKLLNIGVGIHSILGGQIIGYNTQMDEYIINQKGNHIILHFEKMTVLKGEYFMNIACWGVIEQNHYDYKPAYKTLKIFSTGRKNNYRGFLDVPHEWYTG